MAATEAEDWAFTFTANAIRDRIGHGGEALDTIAYTLFDHDLEGPKGNRIHLTEPGRNRPAIFIEKLGDEVYDIVIVWGDDEKHRSELQDELIAAAQAFMP